MHIRLLYFNECPNWRTTGEHLRTLAAEVPGLVIEHEVIETVEAAERLGFRGSPTVLIDGVDPFADASAPVGLACRLYQTADGVAGSPTLEQLRDAMQRA